MTEGLSAEPGLDRSTDQDSAPSGPAMDLLETAWTIIANAGAGDWDSLPAAWREAAEKWRDRYHAVLASYVAANPEQAAEPSLPEGVYGRVEMPGYRQDTGWITEETRFGQQMAVVRDWDGHETAAVAIGPACRVAYLPTPLKRPDERAALPAAGGSDDYAWASDEDFE